MNFTEMLQGYTGKPLADCDKSGAVSGFVGDRPTQERRQGAACHRAQAVLYQCRVSDRKAAVQQPYQSGTL